MFGEVFGQGWLQIGELALAFVLAALIGLEREIKHKSAGLRTYTLVGFASALIMLVSKYGFTDVLIANRIVLDPSRIAAQIVSGIGFIGGGLIFVRRDSVRGLTTAAVVWVTAAIGMACGAGLPILALFATAGHFIVILVFPAIVRRLPHSRWTPSHLQVSYEDGRGLLREILVLCTHEAFAISRMKVVPEGAEVGSDTGFDDVDQGREDASYSGMPSSGTRVVTVQLEMQGVRSIAKLAAKLSEIRGVVSVSAGDLNAASD
jgi:putative Mg2+ transporter-C (MgtC) family protein